MRCRIWSDGTTSAHPHRRRSAIASSPCKFRSPKCGSQCQGANSVDMEHLEPRLVVALLQSIDQSWRRVGWCYANVAFRSLAEFVKGDRNGLTAAQNAPLHKRSAPGASIFPRPSPRASGRLPNVVQGLPRASVDPEIAPLNTFQDSPRVSSAFRNVANMPKGFQGPPPRAAERLAPPAAKPRGSQSGVAIVHRRGRAPEGSVIHGFRACSGGSG